MIFLKQIFITILKKMTTIVFRYVKLKPWYSRNWSPLWKFPADMSKARAVLWPHSCHFNKRDENEDQDQDQDQDQDLDQDQDQDQDQYLDKDQDPRW